MKKTIRNLDVDKKDKGKTKASKRPKKQHDMEWEQRKDFYPRFVGLLKRMKTKTCDFSMEDLTREKKKGFSVKNLPLWAEENLIVRDRDGVPVMFYLCDALRRPFVKQDPILDGLKALKNFITEYPPNPPKKGDPRHKGKHEIVGTGVHHLALWHGIGHDNDPAVISSDIISRGWRLNSSMMLFREFTPITQSVGALFECVDKESYDRYRETFCKYVKKSAGAIFETTKRNCFMGMAILTGICVNPHRDSRDVLDGWVADLAFGDFEGGFLEIPQIGLQFKLRPGDVVFMRSGLLQHSISETYSGRRIGVVLFSHEANFQEEFC